MTGLTHLPAKTKLEVAILDYENHIQKVGNSPTKEQLNHLSQEKAHVDNFAQITQRLEEYYGFVDSPQYDLLTDDQHKSSRLGENMRAVGRPKPTDRYDAHAIVSGGHTQAAQARLKLVKASVGVDEPVNGAWLPRSGKDSFKSNCWATPGAVPHSRTHRNTYYTWVTRQLLPLRGSPGISEQNLVREKLRIIGERLESGDIPQNILDEMRYDDLQNC